MAQGTAPVAKQNGRHGEEIARRETAPGPFAEPFTFMRRFAEDVDRMFDDWRIWGKPALRTRPWLQSVWGDEEFDWSPQIEVVEKEGSLTVRAELPGLKKEDVDVEVRDNQLILRGERRSEHEEKKEGVFRSERSYGRFYRAIGLPEGVGGEDAEASFRDGVLEVRMSAPKQQTNGRKITVK